MPWLRLSLGTPRIVKELSVFVLKLWQVSVEDVLCLVKVLAFEEGAATMCPIVLVTNDARLEDCPEALEVAHYALIFPDAGYLSDKEPYINFGTLD